MKYFFAALAGILVALCCAGIVTAVLPKADFAFADEGEAVFRYGERDAVQPISSEDLSRICDLLDGKRLYSDDPSCGFSDDVSVVMNGTERFCFACDSCPVVYWKNKNKFIKLSEKENEELKGILALYGFEFPCL